MPVERDWACCVSNACMAVPSPWVAALKGVLRLLAYQPPQPARSNGSIGQACVTTHTPAPANASVAGQRASRNLFPGSVTRPLPRGMTSMCAECTKLMIDADQDGVGEKPELRERGFPG